MSLSARQAFDRLVVQSEIENGVHHAGHRELRAGSDAEQQRIRWIAELLAHLLFELEPSACEISCSISLGTLVVVLEIDIADFGGDGEAGRYGHSGAAHLGQASAFAAEDIFHLAVAVGLAAAECVNVFLHRIITFL